MGKCAPAQPLPWFVEEVFSIRMMRHLYYFRRNMTAADWEVGHTALTHRYSNYGNFKPASQYVLTQEVLLEPRYEHPMTG